MTFLIAGTLGKKCASASSIKTRIKTASSPTKCLSPRFVRVHLPLKQGLRQNSERSEEFNILVRVHLPLKQGLRHF